MEPTDALYDLISMVQDEEQHCFNAIHWQPSSNPAGVGNENDNAVTLDWSDKPIAAEITEMMCGQFPTKWDAAFVACPDYRDRLRQLRIDRWTLLARTSEFLNTGDDEAFRQAEHASSAVGLLSHAMKHELFLLRKAKRREAPLEGPTTQGRFVYGGKEAECQNQPWRLLQFMWDKDEADVDDAFHYACGDHEKQGTEAAIKSMVSKANLALVEASYPKNLSKPKNVRKILWIS